MSKTALFIRHQAKPGKRDDVRRIWEQHVKPRVEANPGHEAYFFCYDETDPDVICVFQLYTDVDARHTFTEGSCYPAYLNDLAEFVNAPPQITHATPVWTKEPYPFAK